jgi:hypothetical protein
MRGRDANCRGAQPAPAEAPPHSVPEGTHPDDEISGALPDVAGGYRPIRGSASGSPLAYRPSTTHR